MEIPPAGQRTSVSRRPRLPKAGPAVVLCAGLALFLAACGGSSSGNSSGSGSSGSGNSSTSHSSATGPVAFAQCMRSNGVQNFPDPQNGHFLINSSAHNNPNFQPAVQKCQHLLGPSGATNSGANNSKLLAFAHCMQTHGVPQFPDPASNGAISIPAGVNPKSATYQKAWNECKSHLPGSLQGQQP